MTRRYSQVLVVVLILAVTVIVMGGWKLMAEKPPIPAEVITESGEILFTEDDIRGGQAVFQRYGLMDYGSIFGHGAYLGPDFTAEYLHEAALLAREYYAQDRFGKPSMELTQEQLAMVDGIVKIDFRQNRYNAETNALTVTGAQAYAYRQLVADYHARFVEGVPGDRLPEGLIREESLPAEDRYWISEKPMVEQLTGYFFWTAWTAAAERPGLDYTYTNNWPPETLVGNVPSSGSVLWSAASVGLLLLLLGLALYLYRRYFADTFHESELPQTPAADGIALTPSQVKAAKYFLIVAGLFLFQSLLGGLLAHYFVEEAFYGIPLQDLLPFNIARGWHLQTAIFWIATAWLGAGLFLAPIVGGREPKHQGLLVDILFGAVVLVAVGSLAGEWLGAKGYLGKLWFLLGHQGWEYLELGRIWQILLFGGMLIWVFIVYRALRPALQKEDGPYSLTHLFLYAGVAIPVFYGFGLLYNPSTHFTLADFWRWMVVHLWVEGIFEFFTVVIVANLLIYLGLVSKQAASRAVYFTLILVFGTGLIGVGHHYYWTGAPALWMALGAVFSALEVIPLTLLIFEAYEQYRMMMAAGKDFAYRDTLKYLIATGIWNFIGAGVMGFLINLPIVNYYEHSTYLTPTHGHAAMMGVYGFLALGLLVFTLRSVVKPDKWPRRLVNAAFWLLNGGLVLMLTTTLLPMGFMQLKAGLEKGLWFARSFAFIDSPVVHTLTWLRLPGDLVFIAGVVVISLAVLQALVNLRPAYGFDEPEYMPVSDDKGVVT